MVTRPDEWKWSSCRGYYGQELYPQGLLDCYVLLKMYSPDINSAQDLFKEFNEEKMMINVWRRKCVKPDYQMKRQG